MQLLTPVSPGELLDKLTILEIKRARITDADKLDNIEHEWRVLTEIWSDASLEAPGLNERRDELKAINESLWDIEDDIRQCEAKKDFGERFVELARAVYQTNDRRAEVKKKINLLLGSRLVEEKSYTDYG
jgi:hypothetical protein